MFSSESCLKKFLQEIGDVKHLMEVELLSILSEYLKTESPQLLTTIVQLDLFLVSPNRHEAGEADVHQVTAENCSTFVTHWKDSKLFNFASLHWEGSKFQILSYYYTSQILSEARLQRYGVNSLVCTSLYPSATKCPDGFLKLLLSILVITLMHLNLALEVQQMSAFCFHTRKLEEGGRAESIVSEIVRSRTEEAPLL